jgi:hypothetical protein
VALLTNRTSKEIPTGDDGSTTTVIPRTPAATGKARVDERLAEQRRQDLAAAPLGAGSEVGASPSARAAAREKPPTTEMTLPTPRPRASLMATMALMLGLAAALTVLTGVLAGPGVGIGLLAAFAAIGGFAATGRRHVSGRRDALLGMLLGLAAIVVGVLALTGSIPWLDPGTDQVMRIRDWLDAQAPWLFPTS